MADQDHNPQYSKPLFGYGGSWDNTGAPGSEGAAAHPAMADDALSTQQTMPYQSVQNRPVPMVGVGTDDTAVPGQLYEGFSGLGPSETASTGAGAGHTMARQPNAAQ